MEKVLRGFFTSYLHFSYFLSLRANSVLARGFLFVLDRSPLFYLHPFSPRVSLLIVVKLIVTIESG